MSVALAESTGVADEVPDDLDLLRRTLSARVYEVAQETPLQPAALLSARLGCRVLLKREDLQSVFSFKLRGAYNKMAQLDAARRASDWAVMPGTPKNTSLTVVPMRRSICSRSTWLAEAIVSIAVSPVRLSSMILSSKVAPEASVFASCRSASCAMTADERSAAAAAPARRATAVRFAGRLPASPLPRPRRLQVPNPMIPTPISVSSCWLADACSHFCSLPAR